HVGGEGRVLPGVGDEGDSAQIVDLVRLGDPDGADQAGEVGEVAEEQGGVGQGVAHQVEFGVVLPADQPVHLVALGGEQLPKVEAVLPGDAGDECALHGRVPDVGDCGCASHS